MLGDRQKFDMGETEIADIGRQLVGELAIGQPAAAFVRSPPPGAEMHFVDRDRRIAARCSPPAPAPDACDRLSVDDDRRRLGTQLGGKRDRIGFQRQQFAVAPENLELVSVSGRDRRHEDFPEAVAAHAHGVAAAVPKIEIADDADALRIGRKHSERDARDAIEHERMRAELVIELEMRALAQQIQIEIGQDRRKPIGVFHFDHAIAETHAQPIARRPSGAGRRTIPRL